MGNLNTNKILDGTQNQQAAYLCSFSYPWVIIMKGPTYAMGVGGWGGKDQHVQANYASYIKVHANYLKKIHIYLLSNRVKLYTGY